MSRPVAPLEERRLFAIGLALAAFLLFTGIDTSAKWLVLHDIPSEQVVFLRYAGHFLLILAIVLPRQGLSVFRTASLSTELVRAVALLATTILNFLAVLYLPLTVTGAVGFAMPLLVCALSVPLLGETVGLRRWVAIFVGLVGVLIVIQPFGSDFHWAIMFSCGSVLCVAFYTILTRKLSGRDSAGTMQVFTGIVGTAAMAPFALAVWAWPAESVTWIPFILIGVFGLAGHLVFTVAHRFAPASVLAPFAYSQMIYMTVSSWLIFHQPPDIWLFIGAPIVVASGLYIWLRERQLAKPSPTPVAAVEAETDGAGRM